MTHRQRLTLGSTLLLLALLVGGLLFRGASTVNAQSTVQNTVQNTVTPIDEAAALLQDELNTIEIVKRFGPSVVGVNVEVRGQRQNPLDDLGGGLPDVVPPQFRDFFGSPGVPRTQQASGSGFVVTDGGRLITNYHVIQMALGEGIELLENAAITVVFPDTDEELPVRVVGANPDYDLALLELVDSASLPEGVLPIPLGATEGLRVGQKVIAFGNPFGLQSTVTTGIVSAVGREVPSIGRIEVPMVQTDAAINPGNSGGPLLNSRGELVGINTQIIPGVGIDGRRGNLGIGFAVPAGLLQETLADLEEGGMIGIFAASQDETRPRIGIAIAPLEALPATVRESLNLPDEGILVTGLSPDGPGDRAGLIGPQFEVNVDGQTFGAGGDVILSADGEPVSAPVDLQRIVFAKDAGDTVTLEVWRSGEVRDVEVTLETVTAQEADATP